RLPASALLRWQRPGSRPQRLTVAELQRIASRVTETTVVTHRKIILARRPDQAAGLFGAGSDQVDGLAAVQCEAEMAVVVFDELPGHTAGHHHQHEILFTAVFGHPDDPRALAGTLMNDVQAAEVLVKGNAGVQVGHVQGEVGQSSGHLFLLSRAFDNRIQLFAVRRGAMVRLIALGTPRRQSQRLPCCGRPAIFARAFRYWRVASPASSPGPSGMLAA